MIIFFYEFYFFHLFSEYRQKINWISELSTYVYFDPIFSFHKFTLSLILRIREISLLIYIIFTHHTHSIEFTILLN